MAKERGRAETAWRDITEAGSWQAERRGKPRRKRARGAEEQEKKYKQSGEGGIREWKCLEDRKRS